MGEVCQFRRPDFGTGLGKMNGVFSDLFTPLVVAVRPCGPVGILDFQ